jgi:hypothetical protein
LKPVSKGDIVILPAEYITELEGMPEWVRKQSTWLVTEVVHNPARAGGLLEEGAWLTLVPTKDFSTR